MKSYGPISFTVNTPFQVGIDSSAVAVQIHNNSGLSLRVFFGAAAPANYQDASHWQATISPGSHPVLPVTWNGYSDGTLSLYPFSEQGAPSQASGVIAASSILTLEAYYQGENTPQSVYAPVFQQGAAQQRSIAVPMPALQNGAVNYVKLTQASVFPIVWDFIGVNAQMNAYRKLAAGAGFVNIAFYLHDINISLEGSAAGYNVIYFLIEAVHLSAALAVKNGPQTMFHETLGSTGGVGGSDRVSLNRSSPGPTIVTVPSATPLVVGDLLAIRLARINFLGQWNLVPNIGWSVDVNNFGPLDSYGGGFNPVPTDPTNPRTY